MTGLAPPWSAAMARLTARIERVDQDVKFMSMGVDEIRLLSETADASAALLLKLDSLTTEEFANGGEGDERRLLRTYLEDLKLVECE